MYLKNNLSNLRSSQIKRAAVTKAGSPTWALNLYFPEWEGKQALYSHIFASYWSLVWYQEFPSDAQARPLVPHIGRGWVGSWFADLASIAPDCWWRIHRVSNIKPLQTQCCWSFTTHPIRQPFKQRLLSLLCKYNASHQQNFTTTCLPGPQTYKHRHRNIIKGEVTAGVCSQLFLHPLPGYQVKWRGFNINFISEVLKLYCLIIWCNLHWLQALNATFYFFISYFQLLQHWFLTEGKQTATNMIEYPNCL